MMPLDPFNAQVQTTREFQYRIERLEKLLARATGTTVNNYTTDATVVPNENLLDNPDARVIQRGVTRTLISTTSYTSDRWRVYAATPGTAVCKWDQSTSVPDGFPFSNKITVTTANAAPAAGMEITYGQLIEAQNLFGLMKGTASALSLSLSFWVRASVTGTFYVELYDSVNARFVSRSYTIITINTWEYKSVGFPADASGVLPFTNVAGISVQWHLGNGTNQTAGPLIDTWNTTQSSRVVGGTNLFATINNTWYITGAKLEYGTTATQRIPEAYGSVLATCQRTFQQFGSPGTAIIYPALGWGSVFSATIATVVVEHVTAMRAIPTVVSAGNLAVSDYTTVWPITALGALGAGTTLWRSRLDVTCGAGGMTFGRSVHFIGNNDTTAYVALTAEL